MPSSSSRFMRATRDLLLLSRTDAHALVQRAISLGIRAHRSHRPRLKGVKVEEEEKYVDDAITYILQLYTSAATTTTPPSSSTPSNIKLAMSSESLIPSPSLALFYAYLNQLLQHCCSLLDYAQFLSSLASTSSAATSSTIIIDAFRSSNLAHLLHSALPWLTQCLQQQLDENTNVSALEIGQLVQSALSLLCKCAQAEKSTMEEASMRKDAASTSSSIDNISSAFHGLSLRRMLSLLRESHQFTTTIYTRNITASSASTSTDRLQNVFVPFAQKVLTGLFVEFTQSVKGKNHDEPKLDELRMSQEDFVRFYTLCNANSHGTFTSASTAVTSTVTSPTALSHSLASSSAAAANFHHLTEEPLSLHLPTPPTFHRSHTSATPISAAFVSLNAAAVAAASSSTVTWTGDQQPTRFIPSSVSQLQASAEFHKAAAASARITNKRGTSSSTKNGSSPRSRTVSLAGWLQWHLDGFIENPRAKLEALTLLEQRYVWIEQQEKREKLMNGDGSETKQQSWSSLVREMQAMYQLLLQQVFPPPPTSTTSDSADDQQAKKRSVDDLDLKASVSSSSPLIPLSSSTTTQPQRGFSLPSEFVPKLMESEANWTHHPEHRQFMQFLEKFILNETIQQQQQAIAVKKQKEIAAEKSNPLAKPESHLAVPSMTAPIAVHSAVLLTPYSATSSTDSRKLQAEVKEQLGRSAEQKVTPGVNQDEEKAPNYDATARKIAQSLQTVMSPQPPPAALIKADYTSLPVSAHTGTPLPVLQSSPLASTTIPSEFPGGELEEPARCLSSLFIRCLSEMGGGSAKKRIESWTEAVRAEKAYAAACIKHNGLTEQVFTYSSSVAAVELLRLARLSVNPRTGLPSLRVLSHPSCPSWLKSVVASTFQEVRAPLLTILRGVEEEEEKMQEAQTATQSQTVAAGIPSSAAIPSVPPESTSSTSAVASSALRKSQLTIRKLQRTSRTLVQRVLVNSTFLVKDLDEIQKEIQTKLMKAQEGKEKDMDDEGEEMLDEQVDLAQDDANAINDEPDSPTSPVDDGQDEAEGEDDSMMSPLSPSTFTSGPMTTPTRYRSVARSAAAKKLSSSSSSASSSSKKLPDHLAASEIFADPRQSSDEKHAMKRLHSTPLSIGGRSPMHTSASSAVLPSESEETSSARSVTIAPPALQRGLTDVVRRRRHSVLTISPAAIDKSALDGSPTDEAVDIAQVAQATSITNYLGASQAAGPGATPSTNSSALWSSWSTSSSQQNAARPPYDSKWIHKLIQCGSSSTAVADTAPQPSQQSSLRHLLQPSIHRFQTVCLLRLKLLSWINLCFTQGYSSYLLDLIFPLLIEFMQSYKQQKEAHLLHYGKLILKGSNTKNVLLHFYKHLVNAMNEQMPSLSGGTGVNASNPSTPMRLPEGSTSVASSSPVSYSDPAWVRIRSCLQLLRLDFLSDDTESLVGSGVFASLFRTIQRIDDELERKTGKKMMNALHTNISPAPTPLLQPMIHGFTSSAAIPPFQLTSPAVPSRESTLSDGSLSATTSLLPPTLLYASAYHLKFLCWQTLKSLTELVLLQSKKPASERTSNTVLLSSVARQFVNLMIQQLVVMNTNGCASVISASQSSTNARIPLQSSDGSLMYVLDSSKILAEFTKLKSVCSTHQLIQLLELSASAPAMIQMNIIHLLTYELHRLTPMELNSQSVQQQNNILAVPTMMSSFRSSPLSSPTSPSSMTSTPSTLIAVQFVQHLLERIGQRMAANGVLPSLLLHPTIARTSSDSLHRSPSHPDDIRPPFWHESGYQTWSHYPSFFADNQNDAGLIEEMVIAMRSLVMDRNWRALVVGVLTQHINTLPSILQTIMTLRDQESTTKTPAIDASSLISSFQSSLASLSILGAHSFLLRPDAAVEVLLHGRRTMRGTVLAMDTHQCRVLVRLSPSQPNQIERPYARERSKSQPTTKDGTAASAPLQQELPLAPLIEQEFSFDQVRVIATLPAPVLSDFPESSKLWKTIKLAMEMTLEMRKGDQLAAIPPSSLLTPSLHFLFSLQVQKHLVQMLLVQLAGSLTKLRISTALPVVSDTAAPTTFTVHGSPILSPGVDPVQSPVSPMQSFALEPTSHTYQFTALSPIPSSPPIELSVSPTESTSPPLPLPSAVNTALTATISPRQLRDMTIALPSTVPASAQLHASSPLPASVVSASSSSKHLFDFTSLLPLLLSLTSDFGHQLISLSQHELEHSSSLYSRRLWEVVRSEQKKEKMWLGVESSSSQHKRTASTHFESDSDLVKFIPFDTDNEVNETAGRGTSYRQNLIAALRTYFSQSSGAAKSSSSFSRFLIFPMLDSSNAGVSLPTKEEVGIVVVQLPTTLPPSSSSSSNAQQEAKESAAAANVDPTVPRLLNLVDVGINDTIMNSILPMSSVDLDEAEIEAIELVLGADCSPAEWSISRWQQELSHCSSSTAASFHPPRGEISLTARRVIIGPSGQPAVLTSATPAMSRVTSPRRQVRHLQVPGARDATGSDLDPSDVASNAATVSSATSVATSPSASSRSTANTTNANASSTTTAAPATTVQLQAKYVRTTTQQERASLLHHISLIANQQSRLPHEWQLYDWVDARDSYGDWYLAQILGWRTPSTPTAPQDVLVHFFAWDDMYREWLIMPKQSSDSDAPSPIRSTDRIRNPTLFKDSKNRLESDRFIRKVKIYGNSVLAAMKIERDIAQAHLARDHAKQIASISMSDAYSYPLTNASGSGAGDAKSDSSPLSIGTQVVVTSSAIELLSLQLGRGLLEIASEYLVGDRLMVLDTVNKLCEAEVIECRQAQGPTTMLNSNGTNADKGNGGMLAASSSPQAASVGEIKIHYVGWNSKWDEWISVGSSRIQSRRGGLTLFRRKQRLSQQSSSTIAWNGSGGHASQLIAMVGQSAVITKLARASQELLSPSASSSSSSNHLTSDTLAQVQLLDPCYGSLMCFWTRLSLLKRMDQVDVVHVNLSGVLQLNSGQLRRELKGIEEKVLGLWTSKLIRRIVKSQTVSQTEAVRPAMTGGATAASSPTTSALATPFTPNAAGLTTLPNENATPSAAASSLLSPSFASSVLSSLPLVRSRDSSQSSLFLQSFRRILSSLPRVSQLQLASHTASASGRADDVTSTHNVSSANWIVHPRHRVQMTMESVEKADKDARQQHVFVKDSNEEEKEKEKKEEEVKSLSTDASSTSASNNQDTTPPEVDPLTQAAWLNERMYRNLTHQQQEKLSIITSLVALILDGGGSGGTTVAAATGSPVSASASQPRLTPERCSWLHSEAHELTRSLLGEFRQIVKHVSSSSSKDNMSSKLASAIQTIRPGQTVKLCVEESSVHALVIAWTRSSQPNFEVVFMKSVEDERGKTLKAASSTTASPQLQQQPHSITWSGPSPSPAPPSLTLINDTSLPTSASSSTSASQTTPLVHLVELARVPLLRTGASPLILPNPVYLVASSSCDPKKPGSSAASGEDDTEAVDDDFNIVVMPYSNLALETLLAFTEVMIHTRRECRLNSALASASEVASLDSLLFHLLQSYIEFLSLFQNVCPWPVPRFKSTVYETLAHLMYEMSVSISESVAKKELSSLAVSYRTHLPSFWLHPFILECAQRHENERENWPIFSEYQYRLVEMCVVAVKCEKVVRKYETMFPPSVTGLSASTTAMSNMYDDVNNSTSETSRPPSIHQPRTVRTHLLATSSNTYRDGCSIDDSPLADSAAASPSVSLSSRAHSTSPSVYHTPPPLVGHSREASQSFSSSISHSRDNSSMSHSTQQHLAFLTPHRSMMQSPTVGIIEYIEATFPILLQMHEFFVESRHVYKRSSSLSPANTKCACHDCMLWRGDTPGFDNALMLVDFSSSLWSLLLEGPVRLLPHHARARLFDELLNVSATPERWLPEFSFTSGTERALGGSDSINATRSPTSSDESDSTWDQLVKNLRVTPVAQLRGKLGDVVWKARFKGLANKGAEGLPGPFRQSLTEVCENLRSTTSSSSLLCASPNFHFDTGLDRNKLLLRPLAPLDSAYAFGQLLGVAIRSQGVLDVDMAAIIWKTIQNEELSIADLLTFDYTAYRSLSFTDSFGQAISQEEFNETYEELTWTTQLSDGTAIELVHGGSSRRVQYEERYLYARCVLRTRLDESRLVLNHIRAGLISIIPMNSLQYLTYHELEQRTCGSNKLDLDLLKKHTVYAPKTYTMQSDIIQWFWRTLAECTEEEKAKFIQFAWARSRLPPESGRENTWRMKLNILDSAGPNDLPTSETCFLNVNLPHYRDYTTLRAKLLLAITHCSSINS